MDVVIESTRGFEQDLDSLSAVERTSVTQRLDEYISLFPIQKAAAYQTLHPLALPAGLPGYESSLYRLQISQQLALILAIDEDPIFGQMIFTLFRAVHPDQIDRAYQDIAEALYQELLPRDRTIAQIS